MTRIRRAAVISFVGIVGAGTPTSARAEAPVINHDAVGCIVVDKFPRLEARFDPAENVSRGRLRFRPTGGAHWYSVPMAKELDAFVGVLPKPTAKLKSLDYYVEVTATDFATGRTAEYAPEVVSGLGACQGDKITAGSLGSATIILEVPAGAPAVPAGFSSVGIVSATAAASAAAAGVVAGGGGGVSTTALVVGGVVVAGGAAAGIAAGAGGSADTSTLSITVSPDGQAIVDVTEMTLTAIGSTPGATYSWTFGDGGTATGQTTQHIFTSEGTFTVGVTTSGTGLPAATTVVRARTLNGTWVLPGSQVSFRIEVNQQGAVLAGLYYVEPAPGAPFSFDVSPLTGTVSHPRSVTLTQNGECLRTGPGTVNADLTEISHQFTTGNPLCISTTHIFRRQ